MINRNIFPILSVLLFSCMYGVQARAQKFFNLTADEVKVDSVLPHFTYSTALDGAWGDSVYTVRIEYPEFIEMSKAEAETCKSIVGGTLPAMPDVAANVVVERRRGSLEVSFLPFVVRGGKYMKLVSFMLDVKSAPKPGVQARSTARAAVAPADRYAAHSVLATGRWAKIRVPSTGIYELTETLIRRAGFTDVSRVKVYGYGGALQDPVLNGDNLIEYDDLKEVPTCTVGGRRLFHAQGPVSWSSNKASKRTRNPYSDYGYYFITESDGEPLSVDSTAFVDSFYPSADDYHILHEVDNYSWFQGGRNLFENDPIELGKSKSYVIIPEAGQGGVRTISIGVTSGQVTSGKIEINGLQVTTFRLDRFTEYDHGKEYEGSFRISYYSPSDTVTITPSSGGPVRLDYISVSYETPRNRPILAGTSFPVPEYVYNITNQDLHADGPADMVIIVSTSQKLTEQAQRLKDFHVENDGMRVRIQGVGRLPDMELPIDGITVITGTNSTGKSTVLKALYSILRPAQDLERRRDLSVTRSLLYLMGRIESAPGSNGTLTGNDELLEFLESIESLPESQREEVRTQRRILNGEMDDQLYQSLVKEKLSVEFDGLRQVRDVNRDAPATISFQSGGTVACTVSADDEVRVEGDYRGLPKIAFTDSPFNMDLGVVPLGRRSHRDDIAGMIREEPSDDVVRMAESDVRVAEFNASVREVLNGDFHYGKGGVSFTGTGMPGISVANLAAGMKVFGTMRILVDNGHLPVDSILLLDEPEVHLHPRWINVLAGCIRVLVERLGVRVVMTTHSPQLMMAIEQEFGSSSGHVDFIHMTETEGRVSVRNVTSDLQAVYAEMAEPVVEVSSKFLEDRSP